MENSKYNEQKPDPINEMLESMGFKKVVVEEKQKILKNTEVNRSRTKSERSSGLIQIRRICLRLKIDK